MCEREKALRGGLEGSFRGCWLGGTWWGYTARSFKASVTALQTEKELLTKFLVNQETTDIASSDESPEKEKPGNPYLSRKFRQSERSLWETGGEGRAKTTGGKRCYGEPISTPGTWKRKSKGNGDVKNHGCPRGPCAYISSGLPQDLMRGLATLVAETAWDAVEGNRGILSLSEGVGDMLKTGRGGHKLQLGYYGSP